MYWPCHMSWHHLMPVLVSMGSDLDVPFKIQICKKIKIKLRRGLISSNISLGKFEVGKA